MDMDKNFDAFDNYASGYDLNEPMIGYKYNHSYRVMKEAKNIALSLDLTEEEVYLAEVIGLLHDIARFEQWARYKSFTDTDLFDHGDYAIKILFDENHIKDIDVDKSDYEIIKKAISNHNKYEISKDITDKRELLFSKIIRDADKLDIFYAFSNQRVLEIKEDDNEISPKVREAFFNHEQVVIDDSLSKNDKVVIILGFVYDLNFDYSKNELIDKKYLDSLFKAIKNKERFKEYFDEVNKYLKERK